MPRSQPPVKVNQQHTLTYIQADILVITSKPATPDTNAINLTRSKLTAKEKKHYCTEGLYFYCGQSGHKIFSCHIKTTNRYVKTIQDIQHTPAAQPTSDTLQDLGKE